MLTQQTATKLETERKDEEKNPHMRHDIKVDNALYRWCALDTAATRNFWKQIVSVHISALVFMVGMCRIIHVVVYMEQQGSLFYLEVESALSAPWRGPQNQFIY